MRELRRESSACRRRWCIAIRSRARGWACGFSAKWKRDFADLLRRADAIFIETLRTFIDKETGKSWYDLTSQAFAVFLPVKSVGVMGDGRTYEYVVALRAVQTLDFMTAHWAHLPHELLGHVSNRIINEVRGINRVVYDISGKPPATIEEWEWLKAGSGRFHDRERRRPAAARRDAASPPDTARSTRIARRLVHSGTRLPLSHPSSAAATPQPAMRPRLVVRAEAAAETALSRVARHLIVTTMPLSVGNTSSSIERMRGSYASSVASDLRLELMRRRQRFR